jgi:hypothetical protein
MAFIVTQFICRNKFLFTGSVLVEESHSHRQEMMLRCLLAAFGHVKTVLFVATVSGESIQCLVRCFLSK